MVEEGDSSSSGPPSPPPPLVPLFVRIYLIWQFIISMAVPYRIKGTPKRKRHQFLLPLPLRFFLAKDQPSSVIITWWPLSFPAPPSFTFFYFYCVFVRGMKI